MLPDFLAPSMGLSGREEFSITLKITDMKKFNSNFKPLAFIVKQRNSKRPEITRLYFMFRDCKKHETTFYLHSN